MSNNFANLTFSDSVKKVQEQNGSRQHYSQVEKSGDRSQLSTVEISFIEARDSFYLSSVGENGWPYIQHRGGPSGFLKVIDNHTFAMPDYSGNKQYISTGNFLSNNKAMLFLMDYPNQSRLKIWAEIEVINKAENVQLEKSLLDFDYGAKLERIYVFHVKAYDWNCNQHITPRFSMDEVFTIMKQQQI